MFWTFNLSFDILATVWATLPNIGRIFVPFSGHSVCGYVCSESAKANGRESKTCVG
jgi:hypothetical protein